MSELLSQDRIAALVDAARSGQLAEEPAPGTARRQRRLRNVDFARPTKFTTEQERRLSRALETFCRAASTRLSAELRVPLELELINAVQLTWSNAHAQLPPSAVCAVVETRPAGTRMLLAAELAIVLGAIERLLGGAGETPPRERRLTDIDWVLARHLFATLLSQLEIVWRDLAGPEHSLEVAALDVPMETAQVAAVSEPTLEVTMEARLLRTSATLVLLVPYAAIAPLAAALDSREEPGAGGGRPGAAGHALREVEVTLRAEVGGADLTLVEVLALAPGDVIGLGAPVDGGVTLNVGPAAVHRAAPGRSGSRRAVQVVEFLGERTCP